MYKHKSQGNKWNAQKCKYSLGDTARVIVGLILNNLPGKENTNTNCSAKKLGKNGSSELKKKKERKEKANQQEDESRTSVK